MGWQRLCAAMSWARMAWRRRRDGRRFTVRPLGRRLLPRVQIIHENGRLIIRRRWQPHALAFALWGALIAAAFWMPWAHPHWLHLLQHHPQFALFLRVGFTLLFTVPVFYARRYLLRPQTYVFDRSRDYITANDIVVCALSEMESVRFGQPLNTDGEDTPKQLEFLIHGRNEIVMEWVDLFGAGTDELGLAGQALSEFAHVPFRAEREWRDPRTTNDAAPPAPADPARPLRFARKALLPLRSARRR